jgi:HK97 family phage prohead protease
MDRMTLPVEWKALDGASPDAETGELEGYISAFGTIDLGGDVVMPGAFRKTFSDWNAARAKMPLLTDHDMTESGVIGVVTHMTEDAYGAKVRARFASDTKAQAVRRKMLDLGGSGMSFTYLVVRSTDGVQEGRRVRFLHEVKAVEATVTWVPMNAQAYATAKSAFGDPTVLAHPTVDPSEAGQQKDLADLLALEAWGEGQQTKTALAFLGAMTADDHLAVGTLMQANDLDTMQADLEAWASTVQMPDPQTIERERKARAWQRDNRASYAAARGRAMRRCGHCFGCRTGGDCQLIRTH